MTLRCLALNVLEMFLLLYDWVHTTLIKVQWFSDFLKGARVSLAAFVSNRGGLLHEHQALFYSLTTTYLH